MIVGLSGYARVGKDAVAEILTREYNYEQRAFANALKGILLATNPIMGRDGTRLDEALAMYGADGIKSSRYGVEYRTLLQRLGTEGGRHFLGDTVWIDAAFKDPVDNMVISDVRFPNEADAVRERGGIVVRVNRPGVTAPNDHSSESAMDAYDFDFVIENTGTLDDLEDEITSIIFLANRG